MEDFQRYQFSKLSRSDCTNVYDFIAQYSNMLPRKTTLWNYCLQYLHE